VSLPLLAAYVLAGSWPTAVPASKFTWKGERLSPCPPRLPAESPAKTTKDTVSFVGAI